MARGERASWGLECQSHIHVRLWKGLLIRVGMWRMESRVGQLSFFPPKFHSDNNRKAYLTCMALKYLGIKGQVLGFRSYLSQAKCNFRGDVVSKQTKE